MRSIFRFLLVLSIAIILGVGLYYAEQAAYNVSIAVGLNSADNKEVRPNEQRPEQPRPPATEQNNSRSSFLTVAKRLVRGIAGMGAHFVFVAVVMFVVVLFRKFLPPINSPNLKRPTNPTSKS